MKGYLRETYACLKSSIDKTQSSIFEESKNNEISKTGTPNYLPESLVMDFVKRSPGNMALKCFPLTVESIIGGPTGLSEG